MDVHDLSFRERFLEALAGDPEFEQETRWFDGSILLGYGEQSLWLKIYRGKVIDTLEFTPVFGYTFKISGPVSAWEKLGSKERTFSDLVSAGSRHAASLEEIAAGGSGYRPPELAIEGNWVEVGRVYVGAMHLARCFADAVTAPVEVAA